MRDLATERLAYAPMEVAAALGLGRGKVYQLIQQGRIRALSVGRRLIVPREAVIDFLKETQGISDGNENR